jgi:PAS domain S-box-containing protein
VTKPTSRQTERPTPVEVLRARIEELERAVERRASEQIRELSVAVENAMTGISRLDTQGRFTMVREGYARMLGYRADELLGRSWEATVPPEDRPIGIDAREAMIRQGRAEAVLRGVRKDGSTILQHLLLVKTFDENGLHSGHYCFMRDITAERQAEEQLRHSEARLAEAQRVARIGSFEHNPVDGSGTWSEELFRILGYDVATRTPGIRAFLDRVHPEDRAEVEARFRRDPKTAGRQRFEHRLELPDGRTRHVTTRIEVRKDDAGEAGRIIGTVQDVTERMEADATQQRLEEQLRQSQKMEALGKLAGGVAHDFNNVLTVILGNTEALQELRGLPGDAVECIGQIEAAAQRASALTRQLLTFSRKEVAKEESIDPVAVIDRMRPMLSRLIGEHIRMEFRLPEGGTCVSADPAQLEHAVLNLVLNAADAMPRGGRLTVEVEHDGAETSKRYVKVSVTDTGVGIDPALMDQIFEPFFTTKPAGRGTGLGLSTVYGTVRQMGGWIQVDSQPGEGSRFTLCLPIPEKMAPQVTAARSTAGTMADAPSGVEVVLLCEDDDMVRSVTRGMLARAGYKVLSAETGDQAIDLARSYDGEVDLLISDVVMPGMNGKDLVEVLTKRYPKLRALLVSGYTADVVGGHGVHGNGDGFLHKPYPSRVLLQRVREILDKPGP